MTSLQLDLPIFFHSDTSEIFSGLKMDYSLDLCVQRDMFFLTIDAIAPYVDEATEEVIHSKIFSGGDMFICPMPYNELRALIINRSNK